MSILLLDRELDHGRDAPGTPEAPQPDQPALGYLGLRVYERMAPNWQAADPDNGFAMAWFTFALTHSVEAVIDLFRDSDDGPGWSALLDIDRCPPEWLNFLAQFMGVTPASTISPPLDDAAQRARISSADGFWRGTLDDLKTKAQRHLTGSRRVEVYQYYTGDPWQVRVVTFDAETPDPDVTRADLLPMPAGFRLTYEVYPGQSYAELMARYPTYADVTAAFATYEDVRRNIPTGP